MMDQSKLQSPQAAVEESLEIGAQIAKSVEALSRIRERDVDVGSTSKQLVMQTDKVTLHHYDPLPGVEITTDPVILVYGLIGRYSMADLQEDRSLIRNLLARGVDLYVVDWGNPSRADQFLTLDDYVDDYLAACVDHICEAHNADAITILGICEGGVFSAIYAALHPEKVRNLMLTVTPIDFHADHEDTDPSHGFLNIWTRNLHDEDIDRLLHAFGSLPGEFMGSVFQQMTPVRSLTKYNIDLVDASQDDQKLLNFLRMEKWLADRPHHPAAAARQWLIELYKENRLVKGTLEISGELVDLSRLTMPILNIYAQRDHIIPPTCAMALEKYVGTDDYEELSLAAGHIGLYVSSKSQGIVGDGIYQWLIARQ